jgi:hypothetical protein
MLRFVGRSVLVAALAAAAGITGLAQKTDKIDKIKTKDGSLSCRNENRYNDRLVGNCEMREQTLAPSGSTIAIDGRQNGGVSVKGWDQNQVLVRARVQTGAPTAAEAEALSKEIRIETSGAKIFASGPET